MQKTQRIWWDLVKNTRRVAWGQGEGKGYDTIANCHKTVECGGNQVAHQLVNGVEIPGAIECMGKVDDRSRIEHLLIMGGVEKNPGPGPDGERDGSLTTLTHENALWVFDSAAWTSKTDKYRDRVRALLREFKPRSVAFRRITKCASDVATLQGDNQNDQTRWSELVNRVHGILPQTALSQ